MNKPVFATESENELCSYCGLKINSNLAILAVMATQNYIAPCERRWFQAQR